MTERPSCYNRPPFKEYASGQIGWTEDGRRITAAYPDNMSKGCHQHGALEEAALKKWNCDGCRWRPA